MEKQTRLLSFLILLTLRIAMAKDVISVGVVLDLNSPVGRMAERCMSMARSDFYQENHNYNTRLALLTRDSGDDVVFAASAGTYIRKLKFNQKARKRSLK
jgi:ionotropic glutamate receptor